jgi:hypothetical protein
VATARDSGQSWCLMRGSQLKLRCPLGLSQAAVHSLRPFVSFYTRRLSCRGAALRRLRRGGLRRAGHAELGGGNGHGHEVKKSGGDDG